MYAANTRLFRFGRSIVGIVVLMLLPGNGIARSSYAADKAADPQAERARQYALEFVGKFVTESCYPDRCVFTAEPHEAKLSRADGKLTMTIEGQRETIKRWNREIRKVTARVTLKPLTGEPDLPYGFVVLDFSFTEGAVIPIPTK